MTAAVADNQETSGVRIDACYQCGRCTAGCPVADRMDVGPSGILRLMQLGDADAAMRTEAIWQCVSCLTCSQRCPQSVEPAALIDALRERAIAAGAVPPRRRRTVAFQQAFLAAIRRYGRLHEIAMIGAFKSRSFLSDLDVPFLFRDAMLAPKLMRRGKLALRGQRVRDPGVVDRIFARCERAS